MILFVFVEKDISSSTSARHSVGGFLFFLAGSFYHNFATYNLLKNPSHHFLRFLARTDTVNRSFYLIKR